MTLFSESLSRSVRSTVRVIWYEGTVTTEIQYLGLKDGWMDGRIYMLIVPDCSSRTLEARRVHIQLP